MSYRANNENKRLWLQWLNKNHDLLSECGLPDVVLESEAHLWDLLEHGYLDHHEDSSSFTIEQLSSGQKQRLYRFLNKELTDQEKTSVIFFNKLKKHS